MKSKLRVCAIAAIAMLVAVVTIAAAPTVIAKPSSSLVQIPSGPTDFPGDDQSVIQVTVHTAKKDSIGAYLVRGEITNISNDTLQFVQKHISLMQTINL